MKPFELGPKEMGPFIKSRRLDLELTQQNLADDTGISQSLVSKVEAGKADLNFPELLSVMGFLSVEITFKKVTVKP